MNSENSSDIKVFRRNENIVKRNDLPLRTVSLALNGHIHLSPVKTVSFPLS